MEGKQVWDYDPKTDKFVLSSKEANMGSYVLWFTSKNKYIIIPPENVSDPAGAPGKIEGEFKSHDLFIQTPSGNLRSAGTISFKRIK